MSSDHIRVAIFTDTHIGFKGHTPNLAKESYEIFEEALSNAELHDVDIILHAGDFFHDRNPARDIVIQAMQIAQKYLCGTGTDSKERVPPDVISAEGLTLDPNWLDPNIRIKIPFFLIQGNHDAQSGYQMLSPDEFLSVPKIINFFKPIEKRDVITLQPVVLERGSVRLAIYGLGYIADSDFTRIVSDKKIRLEELPVDPNKKMFSILMVHQERSDRISKISDFAEILTSALPPKGASNHIDLIIWGHEHENKVGRKEIGTSGTFITQPGSTICTQIKKEYAGSRSMAILDIYSDKEEDFVPITLIKPRPFIYESRDLNDILKGRNTTEKKKEAIKECIDDILSEYINDDVEEDDLKKPLVKIVFTYSSIDISKLDLNEIQYGYSKWVVNATKMIKTKDNTPKIEATVQNVPFKDFTEFVNIEDILKEHLTRDELDFIPLDVMNESLSSYVDNNETKIFGKNVDETLNIRFDYLKNMIKEDDFDDALNEEQAKEVILTNRENMPLVEREKIAQTNKPKRTSSTTSPRKQVPRDTEDSDEDLREDSSEGEAEPEIVLRTPTRARPKRRVSKK